MALESNILTSMLTLAAAGSLCTTSKSEFALFSSDTFRNILKEMGNAQEKSSVKEKESTEKKKAQSSQNAAVSDNSPIFEHLSDLIESDLADDLLKAFYENISQQPIVTADGKNNPLQSILIENIIAALTRTDRTAEIPSDKSFEMLKLFTAVFMAFKITNVDVSNSVLQSVSSTPSLHQNLTVIISLYIVGINMVQRFNEFYSKRFNYKKEKKEKLRQMEKERKAKMKNFAMEFEFGIV